MNDIAALRAAVSAELLQAGRQWRRTAERALQQLDISEACAAPLIWTGRLGGGVRQVTLAHHVGIEGPSLVRLLDQLAAAGLIERRDDPTDRRAKTVWLTPSGALLASRIEDVLVETRARVLAHISAEDLSAALRVLRTFNDEAGPSATQEETP
ncbi:MarR family winged helix-turn-helix transcriptional regulator [Ancylobacter lacus]|uniref:MarR family winged helix-turn-helix transcriptional regulator n=1 Tax=Ancylobacter lacus TaxID=2579970 RepID=UPI001BD13DE5|nr:MarR family transcriptional regulator [Ancylobacter lacus]MBS7539838.1 MarR family transcriptional regulator [Ancylobacter lacus]